MENKVWESEKKMWKIWREGREWKCENKKEEKLFKKKKLFWACFEKIQKIFTDVSIDLNHLMILTKVCTKRKLSVLPAFIAVIKNGMDKFMVSLCDLKSHLSGRFPKCPY